MVASKIRVIVAESSDLFRIGLRVLFENHTGMKLIAETDCIEDLFRLQLDFEADVILLDWALIDSQSKVHAASIATILSNSRVLIVCENTEDSTCLQAYHLQAAGIVEKYQPVKLLLEAIHAVHADRKWYNNVQTRPDILVPSGTDCKSVSQFDASALSPVKLRGSERRIAYLASQGLSAKEISSQLSITEKTVRNQLSIIYRKLKIKKKIQLCTKAPYYNNFQ